MLQAQRDSTSPPQWGEDCLEGHFQVDLTNMMMDLTPACMEMDLATENNLYRGFNTAESELNTPDIVDMDIGKILASPDIDIADLINTADIDTDTRMETREDVWGHESFDIFQTLDYGLCLPATLVEGSQAPLAADDDSLIVPDTDQVALEEYENIDILRWIVEDQEIDPLSANDVSQSEQSPESKRVSVIVPVSSPSQSFYINAIKEEEEEEVKASVENLTEDEKYRRMRNQNNDASKRCREKRKRKQQEMEDELELLQEKNLNLRDTVESMEREVKAMKKRLLSDISSK